MNGWSKRSVLCFSGVGSPHPPVVSPMTAVAAAASVPVSSTSMLAWWITFAMNRSRPPVIPEKSARSALTASRMPNALRIGTRPARVSTPNFGKDRLTS